MWTWVLTGVLAQSMLEKNLGLARKAYEDGHLEKAKSYYEKILSDRKIPLAWRLLIQIESGWTYYRMGAFSQALRAAQVVLLEPTQAGAFTEAWLLKGLSLLQLCQYARLFEMLDQYQQWSDKRLKDLRFWMNISQSEWSKIWRSWDKNGYNSLVAQMGEKLPRFLLQDQAIYDNYALKKDQKIFQRVQELARSEIKEIENYSGLLAILKADAQQLFVRDLESGIQSQFSSKPNKLDDQLIFPVSDEMPLWPDELEDYELSSSQCRPKPRRL